jgi:hypothetical protein
MKVFNDLLLFVQPQILRILLVFVSEYQADPKSVSPLRGFALCAVMFIGQLAQTAILHQYFQLCFVTGSRVRAGLVMVIYRKSLVLSNDETTEDTDGKERGGRGDIVNLMSVDASRLQELCLYGLIIASGPFQVSPLRPHSCSPSRISRTVFQITSLLDHPCFHLAL